MASLNGFSVKVPECLSETSENYVVMRHGQQYSLRLSNHHKENNHGKPCDVEVYIDNEFCGAYRIESGKNIVLERPEHSKQRFTAYRIDSKEAKETQIENNSSMGLIRIVFRPGTKKYSINHIITVPDVNPWPYTPKEPEKPWRMPGVYAYAVSDWNTITCSYSGGSRSSLSTSAKSGENNFSYTSRDLIGGGTGLSGESNQKFDEVESLDYDEQATTIYLRLAFEKDELRIRPLKKVYSTRVPNPL